MLKNRLISIGCQKVLLVLAITVFLCGLSGPGYCQTHGPALLLQQIPENAGTITPDTGIHYIEQDTSVTLTAVPRAGYQFVYWLGDVSEPTLNRTNAYLDAPKIIVAVFERAEYELEDVTGMTYSIPGSLLGGLRPSAPDFSRQAFSGGGGARTSVRRSPSIPPEPEPLPPPEIPVPIPEPVTVVLLGIGGLLAITGKRLKI
ncbi:MAG: InlB B-repeat-containing protein [Planctomycetota bacterium]|jgi:hypothetical protein